MRTFDFTPLYRTAVGFDRLMSVLDTAQKNAGTDSYPPYNIEKVMFCLGGSDILECNKTITNSCQNDSSGSLWASSGVPWEPLGFPLGSLGVLGVSLGLCGVPWGPLAAHGG